MSKNIKKKTVNRNEPVAAKPVRRSETLDPWGMYAAGKKEKKDEPRWGRPVGCKAKTGSTTGDPWGQVQSSKKKKGNAEPADGLGSRHGVDNTGPIGTLNRKPMVDNVNLNMLRGTYAVGLSMGHAWSAT